MNRWLVNYLPQPHHIPEWVWVSLGIGAMSLFLITSIIWGQSLPLYIMVLMVTGIAILLHPFVGLVMIMISTMWFERYFTLQSLIIGDASYKLYPLDIVLGLLLFSVVLRVVAGIYTVSWRRFDFPIVLFGITMTGAWLWGTRHGYDAALAFGTYKNYFLYAIMYACAVFICRTRGDWERLMQWFLLGGVGIFFFLLYGFLNGVGLWTEITPLSTTGSRLLAGTHAFYLVLFGAWLVALILYPDPGKAASREWRWYRIALPLVCLGILASLVRHLWIAVGAVVIMWLMLLKGAVRARVKQQVGYGFLVLTAALSTAFLVVLLWTGGVPRQLSIAFAALEQRTDVGNVIQLEDSSFAWRVAAWKAGLSLWLHTPVIGTGLGSTVVGYVGANPLYVPSRELHNNYLGLLVQTGIVGLVIVIWWFVRILKTVWRLFRRIPSEDILGTRLLFAWGSVILLYVIIFSVSVYWDINYFILWWWLALAAIRFLLTQYEPGE